MLGCLLLLSARAGRSHNAQYPTIEQKVCKAYFFGADLRGKRAFRFHQVVVNIQSRPTERSQMCLCRAGNAVLVRLPFIVLAFLDAFCGGCHDDIIRKNVNLFFEDNDFMNSQSFNSDNSVLLFQGKSMNNALVIIT